MLKLEIEWIDGRYNNHATKETVEYNAETADDGLAYLVSYARQQLQDQNQYLTANCIVSADGKVVGRYHVAK